LKYTTYEFSASVPLGQSEFRASYAKGNSAGAGINADDATLFSVEYIYNLSKRTALYTQYGRLTNKGASNLTVGLGTGVAGGNSTGYGAGVRHSF
jgi:predicted porin